MVIDKQNDDEYDTCAKLNKNRMYVDQETQRNKQKLQTHHSALVSTTRPPSVLSRFQIKRHAFLLLPLTNSNCSYTQSNLR